MEDLCIERHVPLPVLREPDLLLRAVLLLEAEVEPYLELYCKQQLSEHGFVPVSPSSVVVAAFGG